MMTTPRRRDELDRAIDAAAGEMAAAILGPSRKSADTSEFLHALRVYTRRPFAQAFPRQDIVAVSRLVFERFGDRMSAKLHVRLPGDLADAIDHGVVDAVCMAVNSVESQL